MRILIGGVPFGRDNVGDEAILACQVGILREACPGAELTVSTDDGERTATKLGVRTVELFGFAPPWTKARLEEELARHDLFYWGGATGLSDYPHIPLSILDVAIQRGLRTVLFGVGMNDELNPVHARLLPGKRRTLLRAMSKLTLGRRDWVAAWEQRREQRIRASIARLLNSVDLAVLRDPESYTQVILSGARPRPHLLVGADPAVLLPSAPWKDTLWPVQVLDALHRSGRRIGFCISAQREVADTAGLVRLLDRLVEAGERTLFLIPMNPVTDAELMAGLHARMRHKARAVVVSGRYEPEEIQALAAKMDVVVSSRLHLLILAANNHVPIVGISRGSKVDYFLKPYGLTAAGTVEACDFTALAAEIERLLDGRAAFEEQSRRVRHELLGRLDLARAALGGLMKEMGG
ncbi:MAG: polysaccharide pyruvyl transferase family protein [Verrucomicrobiota bacterium]|nr:polysaccharide pyruvyl transferase family protein [Verrucomicrobiota bacterium]MDD8045817.1 polysaccharide pyruvyl transferase family protein [Verrucomicrobiota bacterium]